MFTETDHSVQVTLPLVGPMSAQERAWVEDVDRRSGLSGEERLLLVHVARGETMIIDSRAAQRHLARLVEVGIFESSGDRGGTKYHLVPGLGEVATHRVPADEARRVEGMIGWSKRPTRWL